MYRSSLVLLLLCGLPLLAKGWTGVVKRHVNMVPCTTCQWTMCYCVDLRRCDESKDSILNNGEVMTNPSIEEPVNKCPRFQTCCPMRKDPELVKPKTCGIRSGNVPWMLAVLDANNNTFVCGAVLYSLKIAITSLDCVIRYLQMPNGLVVHAGLIKRFDVKFDTNEVTKIISYPGLDKGLSIALLILNTAFKKSSTINPVCQPTKEPKDYCEMTGWGKSRSGRHLEMKLTEMNIKSAKNSTIFAKQIHFVFGYLYPGSFLICKTADQTYELLGIVHTAKENGNHTIAFTNVSIYKKWILDKAKKYVTLWKK